jgi:phosphatidylinositol alpha-1,6-mannosyltransferase
MIYMKKTLLVTIDFAPQTGGVANFLVNLAPRLPAEKLLVLAPKVKNNDVDQNFNFKIFRRRLFWPIWPNWLPMIWQVMNLVKKYKIEKLWAAQPLPVGTVVLMVSKYLDIPYIINAHGMDIAGPMNSGGRRLNLLKKVLFNAQNITVNSEYTRSLILKLGIAKDRIEKIYPCSNISAQSTVLSPQLIIDKYNLRDKKVLLSVGRLVARKGYDTVIKALPVVLKKVPDLVYIIVGDGEYKRNLLELVKSLNLAQNVILTGFIPN